mgnify:CR=1 FL=1|jgi:2-isopropylmalate synthase
MDNFYLEMKAFYNLLEKKLLYTPDIKRIVNEERSKIMKNYEKYEKMYFMPPVITYDWVKKDHIDKAPIWCSVDLRDGNQALIEPMSLSEKLEFFQLLLKIGFKEIEVGFPAASETEFTFIRTLIEKNMIPDDVKIQVLTQSRDHIIRKTFDAVKGAKNAVVHLYNSTSVAQREQVFRKSKEEIKALAVSGAELMQKLAEEIPGNFSFEYTPESFPGTEVDYAVEVCNAVLDVWKPNPQSKVIINIPTTVENAMPHVFASQVEYVHKTLKYRDSVILSLHPHNDRNSSVSDAELGVLAGADRLEGTLFGNGERTGNLDIITVAMNLFSHGVNPELDFSNMPEICQAYQRLTRMQIDPRHPYAGELVFTAFSGSHQDAISKGMAWREDHNCSTWTVPYLPIDPMDIGREYASDVIRINSQSGKGGISYILKQNFGLSLPEKMKEYVGYAVKHVSDQEHEELVPERVYQIFEDFYVTNTGFFQVPQYHFSQKNGISAEITIQQGDILSVVSAEGNGRLDAVSNAIKKHFGIDYEVSVYEEHSLNEGSSSKAVAYVGISHQNRMYWGAGIETDIIEASVSALIVAVNQIDEIINSRHAKDERIQQILGYINANYTTVTLGELADKFYLTQPYLSKYLKDYSGQTFTQILTGIRLKKARIYLKSGNMPIHMVAERVGYPNVEHFNRTFKRIYGLTPRGYRNQKEFSLRA